ncbi:MAG: phosphatase PAP2 family protein [Cyclobacteriaceae bacterium]|jgi:membrane-associated phospholipid phosphatase|nr:phosphatase PAP2 family protein [Cyclobacteriaceae bacterium]
MPTQSLHRPAAKVLPWIVHSLALLLAAAVLVPKGSEVYWLNGLHHPWLDTVMKIVTWWGEGLFLIPLLIASPFFSWRATALVAGSWLGHGLVCVVVKRLLFPGMSRPIAVLDASLLHVAEGVKVHAHYSFPSGHTATAFCIATVVILLARRQWIGVTLTWLALGVALSRIYLLQHFLVDVAAGAVIGAVVPMVVWLLLNHHPRAWMEQQLRLPRVFKSRFRQPRFGAFRTNRAFQKQS